MTFFQALILGIVQGLTEFIPISSSAHLALVPYWLHWNLSDAQVFLFGVLIQMGTLIAVIVYFWGDLIRILKALLTAIRRKSLAGNADAQLGYWILLATIPAGLVGLLLKNIVESAFNNPRAIAIFLLFTALMLWVAERAKAKNRAQADMKWTDALWIGLSQVLALFPGISRSGATISGGLLRGFNRKDASRFSFLMSIPVMAAAGVLSLSDLRALPSFSADIPALLVATLAAAVVGYLSIRWLIGYVSRKPFTVFSIYCAVVGGLTLILTFLQ